MSIQDQRKILLLFFARAMFMMGGIQQEKDMMILYEKNPFRQNQACILK